MGGHEVSVRDLYDDFVGYVRKQSLSKESPYMPVAVVMFGRLMGEAGFLRKTNRMTGRRYYLVNNPMTKTRLKKSTTKSNYAL